MSRATSDLSDPAAANKDAGHMPKPKPHFHKYLPQNLAAEFSRRVLEWLYSFSLVILMLFTLGLVVVTPVDVIIQTKGTSSMGVKLFIIIVSNAFFLFLSVVYYFSRLIRSRVLVNQIPSKSVYLPLEKHDLRKKTRHFITQNLCRCVGDIKVRAGPLYNESESFEYPGMAPPKYIQQRNMELGFQDEVSGLPDECVFQDVINSIGLKIRTDGLFAGNFAIPKNYTFREVILAMAEELDEEGLFDPDSASIVRDVVSDYERFKFGPGLITQHELVAFLANMESLMYLYLNTSGGENAREDVRRASSATNLYSEKSFPDTSDGDSAVKNVLYSPKASSFLDPFDYCEEAPSLRRRSSYDAVSKLSTRNRDRRRPSTELSQDQSASGRRGSSWSAFKSRISGESARLSAGR